MKSRLGRKAIVLAGAIIVAFMCHALAQIAATVGSGRNQAAPTRKPSYHNHPATPLLFEDFEKAVGYDLAGWGENIGVPGVIDEDYVTTVLYGTQSLLIDEANDDPTYTTNSFTASGHVWVAMIFRPTSIPNGIDSTVLRLNDVNDVCQLRMTLNNDGGTLKIWPQCGTPYATAFGMTINTTYYVWIEYNKNNGANSYASIGFSTTGVRPTGGGTFVEGTDVSSATDVSRIQLGHTAAENGQQVDFILDHLLVDDEQIVNYP